MSTGCTERGPGGRGVTSGLTSETRAVTPSSAGGRGGINMNVWQHFERFVASDGILADDSEATKELAFVHYSPYLQDPRFVFDKLIKVLRSESADMERDRRADEARELRELKEKLEELTHVRDLLGHQVQLSRAKELTVSGSRVCLGKSTALDAHAQSRGILVALFSICTFVLRWPTCAAWCMACSSWRG